MLIYGCCVGPSGKFETIAEPALQATMSPHDLFIREDGKDGICAAYNRILTRARAVTDCEGVILLHDDVALGEGSRDTLHDALQGRDVGVVGVVGGRGLFRGMWSQARFYAGRINDSRGETWFKGPVCADVDVVDGLLLAIAPNAFRRIDFDEENLTKFHGYDTDYCLRTRSAKLRVLTADISYRHHDKAGFGDATAFREVVAWLEKRWPGWIVPLSFRERLVRRAREETAARWRKHITRAQ